jgi:calcineurin-like phosphoesterase family protein
MEEFNVDILKDNNQAINKQELLYFMGKFQLKSKFSENITKVKFQLDHIWTNVLRNECKYGVTKTYWSDFHKLIYIAFKLLNTLPMYNKKPLMFPFI